MIAPYKRPRPRPELALLLDADTVLGERGREQALARALDAGVHVWAPAEQLRELTRQGKGSAVLWRYAAIGWSPDRSEARTWPVRALQLPVPDDPRETIRGLRRWRDWLCGYGAAPAGSVGGSGLSLVKATLTAPLWTAVGNVPPIRYTLGGRQQDGPGARPALVRGRLRQYDLQAAYARTLGGARYGGRWERIDYRPWVRLACEKDPFTLVYARALVEIPDTLEPWQGPLPVRPRKPASAVAQLFWNLSEDVYPVGRRLQGCWTWNELLEAEAAGCRIVRVLDVWYHGAGERPFLPWLEAVERGRELGGFAAMLAKATGNATWGQFAIAKGQKLIATASGSRPARLRGGNPSQRAFDLAEWIAGTVRAKLHAGILAAGGGFVTAHTDGLWTSSSAPIRGWRCKAEADELRIFNPQTLAHRRAGEPWRYVVAGALDPESYFEQRWTEAAAA